MNDITHYTTEELITELDRRGKRQMVDKLLLKRVKNEKLTPEEIIIIEDDDVDYFGMVRAKYVNESEEELQIAREGYIKKYSFEVKIKDDTK